MIDIEKEMKSALNVSEEEFCKYLEPGTTKSLAWWNDMFKQDSHSKEVLADKPDAIKKPK